MHISEQAAALNEKILFRVESIGGGYVWDADIFAVTLIDIEPTDSDISELSELRGVQQIAINASKLTFPAVLSVARTPGLESLVLSCSSFTDQQHLELEAHVPELILVSDEA
jgi:hypothetical protein